VSFQSILQVLASIASVFNVAASGVGYYFRTAPRRSLLCELLGVMGRPQGLPTG
jgi:hypothetical protein